MNRTAITRFSAALSLGLIMSALNAGTIVAGGRAAQNAGSVHPAVCSDIRAITPAGCIGTSSTTLTSNVNPSVFGQPVTFTATVEGHVLGIRPAFVPPPPTGTVDFTNGVKSLCPGVTLDSNGVATCTTDGLTVGNHAIGANYNGDFNYDPSEDALGQVVDKAGTHSIISSSSRNSHFGQSVTLGVLVFTAKPGGGIPTGKFQFRIDGVKVGAPVTLGGDGRAFLPPMSDLSVGPHLVGGKYLGDANHRQTKPVRLLQYVNPAS